LAGIQPGRTAAKPVDIRFLYRGTAVHNVCSVEFPAVPSISHGRIQLPLNKRRKKSRAVEICTRKYNYKGGGIIIWVSGQRFPCMKGGARARNFVKVCAGRNEKWLECLTRMGLRRDRPRVLISREPISIGLPFQDRVIGVQRPNR
jgi:hypothetical protein